MTLAGIESGPVPVALLGLRASKVWRTVAGRKWIVVSEFWERGHCAGGVKVILKAAFITEMSWHMSSAFSVFLVYSLHLSALSGLDLVPWL